MKVEQKSEAKLHARFISFAPCISRAAGQSGDGGGATYGALDASAVARMRAQSDVKLNSELNRPEQKRTVDQ
jgi:hypothetical protein